MKWMTKCETKVRYKNEKPTEACLTLLMNTWWWWSRTQQLTLSSDDSLFMTLSLSCLFSNLIMIMIINQTPAAPVEVLAMLSISSDFGLILKTFPMAMVFPSSLKVNLPNWGTSENFSTQIGAAMVIRTTPMDPAFKYLHLLSFGFRVFGSISLTSFLTSISSGNDSCSCRKLHSLRIASPWPPISPRHRYWPRPPLRQTEWSARESDIVS